MSSLDREFSHICTHHFTFDTKEVTKVCFFEDFRSFLHRQHPYERKSGFDLRGLEGGQNLLLPLPRLVTKRPAIVAVSFYHVIVLYRGRHIYL